MIKFSQRKKTFKDCFYFSSHFTLIRLMWLLQVKWIRHYLHSRNNKQRDNNTYGEFPSNMLTRFKVRFVGQHWYCKLYLVYSGLVFQILLDIYMFCEGPSLALVQSCYNILNNGQWKMYIWHKLWKTVPISANITVTYHVISHSWC